MKNIISIIKSCVKDGNISPQLDNIEFTDDTILVYKDSNLIITKNETPIRGYVNGRNFIKTVESFKDPQFIDHEKKVLVKEGRRKVTINKYILSGGEDKIELPKAVGNVIEISLNEEIYTAIKLCLHSAKGNNINASGDGIVFDFTSKFKKIYASNGDTMTISSIFSKDKFKGFVPYFIVESINKYYDKEKSAKFKFTDTYIEFDNSDFKFISLYSITDEVTNISDIINKISVITKNIKLNTDIIEAVMKVINLTEKKVTLEFKKNIFEIYGFNNNSIIEDSIVLENEVENKAKMIVNKDFLKYAIKNFETFDLCRHKDIEVDLIRFKRGKVSFYISPILETEGE